MNIDMKIVRALERVHDSAKCDMSNKPCVARVLLIWGMYAECQWVETASKGEYKAALAKMRPLYGRE